MFKQWQLFVLGVCFAMLFGLVGSYDYENELASQSLYCDMVAEGTWPAYDKKIDCNQ